MTLPKTICPYCRKKTAARKGTYRLKRRPRIRRRFYCPECNKSITFGKKRIYWDYKVHKMVKRLVNEKRRKPVNKYDHRKYPERFYYSSREIVKMIKSRWGIRISKSSVALKVKEWRKIEDGYKSTISKR